MMSRHAERCRREGDKIYNRSLDRSLKEAGSPSRAAAVGDVGDVRDQAGHPIPALDQRAAGRAPSAR